MNKYLKVFSFYTFASCLNHVAKNEVRGALADGGRGDFLLLNFFHTFQMSTYAQPICFTMLFTHVSVFHYVAQPIYPHHLMLNPIQCKQLYPFSPLCRTVIFIWIGYNHAHTRRTNAPRSAQLSGAE